MCPKPSKNGSRKREIPFNPLIAKRLNGNS
jgi:hypothetical protein